MLFTSHSPGSFWPCTRVAGDLSPLAKRGTTVYNTRLAIHSTRYMYNTEYYTSIKVLVYINSTFHISSSRPLPVVTAQCIHNPNLREPFQTMRMNCMHVSRQSFGMQVVEPIVRVLEEQQQRPDIFILVQELKYPAPDLSCSRAQTHRHCCARGDVKT